MSINQPIVRFAKTMRVLTWCIFAAMLLCLFGAPTLFNHAIELSGDNSWLVSGYILSDTWLGVEENLFADTLVNLSSQTMLGVSLVFLVFTLLVGCLFWQVDHLLRQYGKGDVFSQCTAKRFKYIGILLLVLFAANTVGSMVLDSLLEGPLPMDAMAADETVVDAPFDPWNRVLLLDFSLLLSGLFMMVVARVMEMGVVLQQDVDATI